MPQRSILSMVNLVLILMLMCATAWLGWIVAQQREAIAARDRMIDDINRRFDQLDASLADGVEGFVASAPAPISTDEEASEHTGDNTRNNSPSFAPDEPPQAAGSSALAGRLRDLESEFARLKYEIASVPGFDPTMDVLRHIAQMEERIETLERSEDDVAENERDVQKLATELTYLKQDHNTLSNDMDDLKRTVRDIEYEGGDNRDIARMVSDFQSQLTSLVDRVRTLERGGSDQSIERSIDDLGRRIDRIESRVSRLERDR